MVERRILREKVKMKNEEQTAAVAEERTDGSSPGERGAAPETTGSGGGDAGKKAPAEKRYLFDFIGDFFEKMTIGILKFAFVKLPVFVWRLIRERLRGLIRAVFWSTLWLFIICAAWMMAAWQTFVNFWREAWVALQSLLLCVGENIGVIWFVIAMIGSVYGLCYVTRKWREQMMERISFLLRRKEKGGKRQ